MEKCHLYEDSTIVVFLAKNRKLRVIFKDEVDEDLGHTATRRSTSICFSCVSRDENGPHYFRPTGGTMNTNTDSF